MEAHPELSVADATKQAMGQITAPIIAITLVLLSVFVPVAFIPGISGELFRQFAVTVAVSMFISAINALTLSPALCAVLLKPHHGPRRGIIGIVMRSIDRVRDAYGGVVARLVRMSLVSLLVVGGCLLGTGVLSKLTPTGFLPQDDQGAFFVIVQLPDGASVGRTADVVGAGRGDPAPGPGDRGRVEHRRAELHRQLQPVQRRLHRGVDEKLRANGPIPSLAIGAVFKRLRRQFRGLRGGIAVPLAPPPIIGLGTGGGFTYVRAGRARRRPEGDGRGGARPDRRRQPGPALVARVQHLFGQQPVGVPRYRPRQGAGAGGAAVGGVPGARHQPGRRLRQRHQSVRPHLAGPGAGRGGRPRQHRRHLPHQRAQQPTARWCRCAAWPRCASSKGRRR